MMSASAGATSETCERYAQPPKQIVRFQVRARTESRLGLTEPVHHEFGRYTVHLLPGDGGTLAELGMSMRVDDYQGYLPSITTAEGELPHIRLSGGPFVEELIDLLQYVESIGSFWLELQKVGWEDPTFEWIPESEAERPNYRSGHSVSDTGSIRRRDRFTRASCRRPSETERRARIWSYPWHSTVKE